MMMVLIKPANESSLLPTGRKVTAQGNVLGKFIRKIIGALKRRNSSVTPLCPFRACHSNFGSIPRRCLGLSHLVPSGLWNGKTSCRRRTFRDRWRAWRCRCGRQSPGGAHWYFPSVS